MQKKVDKSRRLYNRKEIKVSLRQSLLKAFVTSFHDLQLDSSSKEHFRQQVLREVQPKTYETYLWLLPLALHLNSVVVSMLE